jgi:CheY-like chemotaxis protein
MTAGVSKTDYDKSHEAGMNGFIRKPVKIEEISATLLENLSRLRQTRASGAG